MMIPDWKEDKSRLENIRRRSDVCGDRLQTLGQSGTADFCQWQEPLKDLKQDSDAKTSISEM